MPSTSLDRALEIDGDFILEDDVEVLWSRIYEAWDRGQNLVSIDARDLARLLKIAKPFAISSKKALESQS